MVWNDAKSCSVIPSSAYRWHRSIVKDQSRRKGEELIIQYIILCLITELNRNKDADQIL